MSELHNRCQVARNLLKNGAHLIDVRTEEEFKQGALSGAINIPLKILSQVSHMLDKTSNIIVYCGTGMRSKNAHEILDKHDFDKIHDLGSFKTLQYC